MFFWELETAILNTFKYFHYIKPIWIKKKSSNLLKFSRVVSVRGKTSVEQCQYYSSVGSFLFLNPRRPENKRSMNNNKTSCLSRAWGFLNRQENLKEVIKERKAQREWEAVQFLELIVSCCVDSDFVIGNFQLRPYSRNCHLTHYVAGGIIHQLSSVCFKVLKVMQWLVTLFRCLVRQP